MEFIEVETRDFNDYVIEGWFKEGACGLGNRILEFIQVKTNGQFRSDFGNGITCCFRGQSRTSTYSRVDFDCNDLFIHRVYAKLHVAAPAKIPILRIILKAISRILWKAVSLNVIAGATVMESPV